MPVSAYVGGGIGVPIGVYVGNSPGALIGLGSFAGSIGKSVGDRGAILFCKHAIRIIPMRDTNTTKTCFDFMLPPPKNLGDSA